MSTTPCDNPPADEPRGQDRESDGLADRVGRASTRIDLLDVLACPCGGRRAIVGAISDREVVVAILAHLGLPSPASSRLDRGNRASRVPTEGARRRRSARGGRGLARQLLTGLHAELLQAAIVPHLVKRHPLGARGEIAALDAFPDGAVAEIRRYAVRRTVREAAVLSVGVAAVVPVGPLVAHQTSRTSGLGRVGGGESGGALGTSVELGSGQVSATTQALPIQDGTTPSI